MLTQQEQEVGSQVSGDSVVSGDDVEEGRGTVQVGHTCRDRVPVGRSYIIMGVAHIGTWSL